MPKKAPPPAAGEPDLRRVLRVFLGSPGDVKEERGMFEAILREMNRYKAKGMGYLLEHVMWEDTLPGRGRPQGRINADLESCALVVLVVWNRWGTPTGDGRYSSGFEEEYEVSRAAGKDIHLYFRTMLPEVQGDPGEQAKKVLAFQKKVRESKDLLYVAYHTPEEWAKEMKDHLASWLDQYDARARQQGAARGPSRVQHALSAEARVQWEAFRRTLDADDDGAPPKVSLAQKVAPAQRGQASEARKLARQARQAALEGEPDKAGRLYGKAVALYPAYETIDEYATFLAESGSPDKALEILRQLEAVARSAGDPAVQAVALDRIGRLQVRRGELEPARRNLGDAQTLYRSEGNAAGMVETLIQFGTIAMSSGDPRAAAAKFQEACAEARAAGSPPLEAKALVHLGFAQTAAGQAREALVTLDRALAIAREAGDKRGEAASLGNIGNAHAALGDPRRAAEAHEAAIALSRASHNARGEVMWLMAAGQARAAFGDLRRAIASLEEAVAVSRRLGDPRGTIASLTLLGMVHSATGDARRAVASLEAARGLAEEAGDASAKGGTLYSLGMAYFALGDGTNAVASLEEAAAIAREAGNRQGEASSRASMGFIHAQLGNRALAIDETQAGLRLFEAIGSPFAETARQQLAFLRGGGPSPAQPSPEALRALSEQMTREFAEHMGAIRKLR